MLNFKPFTLPESLTELLLLPPFSFLLLPKLLKFDPLFSVLLKAELLLKLRRLLFTAVLFTTVLFTAVLFTAVLFTAVLFTAVLFVDSGTVFVMRRFDTILMGSRTFKYLRRLPIAPTNCFLVICSI